MKKLKGIDQNIMNKCLNCFMEYEEDTIVCPYCYKIYCDKDQYNNIKEGEENVTIEQSSFN